MGAYLTVPEVTVFVLSVAIAVLLTFVPEITAALRSSEGKHRVRHFNDR